MHYQVILSSQAAKDAAKLKAANLAGKAKALIEVVQENPYAAHPSYEKLSGRLKGQYSRRLNLQHRFVYAVDEENKIVHVLRMWTHYDD